MLEQLTSLSSQLPTWAQPLCKAIDSILTNPLNIILFLLLVYVLVPHLLPSNSNNSKWTPSLSQARSYSFNSNDRFSYLPATHPDCVEWTKYTPRTLAVYDGTGPSNDDSPENSRILLAINRKVFDVTKGKNFYGPGGPYGNFAGRDASRGMAEQSFDTNMLTPLDKPIDTLEGLSPSEMKNMKEWEGHFTAKYGVVGELVDEHELEQAQQ